jgi:hypothetical protein
VSCVQIELRLRNGRMTIIGMYFCLNLLTIVSVWLFGMYCFLVTILNKKTVKWFQSSLESVFPTGMHELPEIASSRLTANRTKENPWFVY